METDRLSYCPSSSRLSFYSGLPPPKRNVKNYIVNLDLPPNQRWSHIVEDYKHLFPEVQKYMLDMVAGVLGTTLTSILKTIASGFAAMINKSGVVYYGEELQAIANQTGFPVGDLLIMQLSYELAATCTSIIAVDDQGIPLHGRTMDWDLPILSKMTVELEFQRNSETIFYATSWAGYVGVLTGMRKDAYSVAVNFRLTTDGSVWKNMIQAITSAWPTGFLVRVVLDESKTFDDAIAVLANSELISPSYFTVAGCKPNEGVIISRNRKGEENRWKIADHGCIVQPNCDHWDAKPQYDIIYSVDRRFFVKSCFEEMKAKNVNASLSVIRDILQIRPCWNDETVYASFMCPKDNLIISYIPPVYGTEHCKWVHKDVGE
eukprot:TRINITY_DN9854_c0_g1_i1.p1 TRINITY_DN9854_c0_g1~~TRINITY_DN9854_c0_g1_i1.p1  ORF type:complete len:376 (+),score=56.64 TRINITY_DN9854_c0_g1_i1:178-1305(+)